MFAHCTYLHYVRRGQVSRCTVSELSEEEGRLLASRSLSAPFNCSAVRGGKI